MDPLTRKSFQGVMNIIRFNWHYYIIAIGLMALLFLSTLLLPDQVRITAAVIVILIVVSLILSLAVSWYIYDHSPLYTLNWLDRLGISPGQHLVNINAGFDETSPLIAAKYPGIVLNVFDFYDPLRHTEISIERARKTYSVFPGTETISTTDVPLAANSTDFILLILSAHEIRKEAERVIFFTQLRKALTSGGRIVVVEHQRDLPNFIAYNAGFLHFFSAKTWKQTFAGAGLSIRSIEKITPFISTFILSKNGTAT